MRGSNMCDNAKHEHTHIWTPRALSLCLVLLGDFLSCGEGEDENFKIFKKHVPLDGRIIGLINQGSGGVL